MIMNNKLVILALTFLIAACSSPAMVNKNSSEPVQQSKSSAPVTFEFNVPKDTRVGEQVTTTVRFVASIDLDELSMSAAPYSGVALVSGGEQVIMTGLKAGDAGELKVTLRLEEEVGYLVLYASTTNTQGKTLSKSATIRYGTAGAATRQKLKSPHVVDGATGQKLILMPAEVVK